MVITPDLSGASSEFQRLVKAINLLKTELLPEDLEDNNLPLDDLAEVSILSTRAKAFTALCHAEIEQYVEDIALRIQKTAITVWKQETRVSLPLLALMIFLPDKQACEFQKSETNEDEYRKKIKNYIKNRVKRVGDSFWRKVENNHGIKEANLCSLLIPIGLKIDSLAKEWIEEIESLADERGTIVHKSRYGTSQPVNPRDKFEQVHRILYGKDLTNRTLFKGLIDIDRELLGLLHQ